MPRIAPIGVLLLLMLSSCAATVREKADLQTGIMPGDLIEVKFKYYPDFDQVFFVTGDMAPEFAGVGKIRVEGLTKERLELRLRREYSDLLALPELNVSVKSSTELSFYVGGAIRNPGTVAFRTSLTVRQGISLAGGLRGSARGYEVVIFRNEKSGSMKMFKMFLDKEGHPIDFSQNIELMPFDVIFVMKDRKAKDSREVLI
jgi:polysaccharide export outer membrane protein